MTPAEKFTKNAFDREALAAVLKSPVLREALAILKDELEPSADDAAAAVNPVLAASQAHRLAGANHVIKGLTRLTLEKGKPKALPQVKPLLTEEDYKAQFPKKTS